MEEAQGAHEARVESLMPGVVYVANSAKVGSAHRLLMEIVTGIDRARFSPIIGAPVEGRIAHLALTTRRSRSRIAG